MKHNHSLFSAFLFVALLFTPNVWAATTVNTYCGFALTSGSSHPTMTWETNFFGDIIITLHDGVGSTHTEFRACGMAENEGLGAFYLKNSGGQLEAKNYFYVQMDGNKYILRRMKKSDDATLEGKNIRFYEKKVLWKCDENASCEELIIFEQPYEKSYICDASLDRPSITSVAPDGTMTFGSVTDATSYVARVYHDLDLLHEQTITSGEKLTYRPYIAASTTYEVTIQAYGAGNAKSRESLPANWTTTGSADNPLPLSKYCDYIFQTENSGNGNGDSRVRLTIETRKGTNSAKDTLVFSISKYDKSDAYAAPEWRSKGFQVEDNYGLRYDGKKFMDYFVIPSTPTPAENGQPRFNGNTEIRYVPKDGATVEYGKRITFNVLTDKRNVEWKRHGGNTNAATTFFSIDYIYGTNCSAPSEPEPEPEHEKPTEVSVDGSKVISFTGVTEETMDSYNAVVKQGETTVKTVTNIISGETVIDYASTSATTYQVYVQAIKDEAVYSTSDAFDWELPKELSAPSEYCEYDIDDNNSPKHHIKLTFETNHVGDVIIRLADGDNTTNAVFRGTEGMGQLDWYAVKSNGGATSESASTYFTREYAGEGATYMALRKRSGVTLPSDAVINYNNHPVQWKSDGVTNPAKTLTMNYTYGSSCATLPLPTITSITEAGVITFPAVVGASSYTARVYDGQTLLYTQENITSGDVINYGAYYSATFQVTLQAFGNVGTYSDESAGTNWALTGDLDNLPESNVCNQLIHQDNNTASYAYLSIETDDSDGSFYITMRPDNAAFRHSEYIVESGLKYDGQALTSYFARSFLDPIADNKPRTIKYTPIDRNNVQYGKNITFNKYSEGRQLAWWTNTSSSQNSDKLSFTYIYGTKCSLEAAFEHSSNVTLYADHAGEDLIVDKAMTINGNGHSVGDITVTTAGALTVGSALTANKLLVNAKPGASGQVVGAANLTVSEAWVSQQVLPDAEELNPATDWYCFTVPFEVSLTDGVYTNAGVKLNSGSDYLIYRYDGEQRAATGRGWVKATENLSAGVAYLIGFKNSETAKTFRFKKATSAALAEPNSITMVEHSSSNAADANWNAVGNPSLRHINITPNTKVQVLNNASQTFAPYQTGEKSFVVGSPFFAQGSVSLTLDAASHALLAPALAPAQRMEACVELYKEGRAWLDDRLYVAADEAATAEWQQGRDLPTLNTTSDRVALMHTSHYGMKLAAVELPWAEQVDYNLVLTAPTNGTYNLHTASVTDGTMVLLTKDGRPVWDLTVGDYALPLTEGTDTSYGLRLIQMAPQVPTDVMNTAAENRHRKVLNRGQLYILRDGRWYNAVGQSIY